MCSNNIMFLIITIITLDLTSALPPSCDPIRIEMCRGLGYNVTSMPNLVGHELQQDAEMQLQTFSPLVQYGCSSQLRLFLCSVYVPMCTDKVPMPIGPCRSLCEVVRSRCQPVLQEFGFPWPSALNCSQFPPENNQHHMCMVGPGEESPERDPFFPPYGGRNRPYGGRQRNGHVQHYPTKPPDSLLPIQDPCLQYKNGEMYVYVNRTERCVPMCHANVLFRSEDKQFAQVWVAVWAILCYVTTFITVITFLIDSSRFKFPEKPIIFIAITYNLYSVGHLVRFVAGREDIACLAADVRGSQVLVQEGLSNTNCVIVFLLLYYFGMASCVWWVILSLTWYLTQGLNWSHESIERHSSVFHVFAWGLPAAQTIAALVMRVVDADELTATCYVGQQSTLSLFIFVLVPQFVYLIFGAGFILVGFLRTRYQQRKLSISSKAEVFLFRVGIFSFLYMIPAVCVFGTNIYEYMNRENWLSVGTMSQPNLEVFMLKIFMTLVLGITSGMWIWSKKTVDTWQRLGNRILHRKQPTPSFLLPAPGKHVIVLDPRLKMPLVKNGSETAV
uniref:Frizzled-4 n=1 Tax=Strigamia maritima TaxID=126957 RepID=T1J7J7_STRMM